MIELSYFTNLFDRNPKKMEFTSWENFESLLYNVHTKKGQKFDRSKPKQKSSPLISPAVFKPGTTRKNDNVEYWSSWCCVDVDEYTVEKSVQEDMTSKYGQYYFVCYSTASSTKTNPKFRVVFPLTCTVPSDKIKHFWYALNTELDSIGDRQTKDLSRMYYATAQYTNAHNFIWTNKGSTIDPYELMNKHPYVQKSNRSLLDSLPESIRNAVLEEKKSRLINGSITWTSYEDCPFMPKKLVEEYKTTSSTGWYNLSYRIMVATAAKALDMGYPITAKQISVLFRQLDMDTGNWYSNRPLEKEATTALNYAFKNSL